MIKFKQVNVFIPLFMVIVGCGQIEHDPRTQPGPSGESLDLAASQCGDVSITETSNSNEWWLEFEISREPLDAYLNIAGMEYRLDKKYGKYILSGQKIVKAQSAHLKVVFSTGTFKSKSFSLLSGQSFGLECQSCTSLQAEYLDMGGQYWHEFIVMPKASEVSLQVNGQFHRLEYKWNKWVIGNTYVASNHAVTLLVDKDQRIEISNLQPATYKVTRCGGVEAPGEEEQVVEGPEQEEVPIEEELACDITVRHASVYNQWWHEFEISPNPTSASLTVLDGASHALENRYGKWILSNISLNKGSEVSIKGEIQGQVFETKRFTLHTSAPQFKSCSSEHIEEEESEITDPPREELPVVSENKRVFLLMGQSNMEGAAGFDVSDYQANDAIKMLAHQNANGYIYNQIYTAKPPLHNYQWSGAGLSPGYVFAKEVIDTLGGEILLVPLAKGGQSVDYFAVEAYQDNLNRIKEAQEWGEVSGILWHQGESNNGQRDWPQKVANLLERIKKDASISNVPVLVGELVQDSYYDFHNATLIPELVSKIPNAYKIESDGLTNKDANHFDLVSVRKLGKRYAGTFKSLLGETPVSPEVPMPASDGFTVKDGQIIAPSGKAVFLKGVNFEASWKYTNGEKLDEVAKTGANNVRIVWNIWQDTAKLKTVLQKTLDQRMVPVLELHDATTGHGYARQVGEVQAFRDVVNWWLRDDVRNVLLPLQDKMMVNIANETFKTDFGKDRFVEEYSDAIHKIRNAGYTAHIVIDGPNWAQDYRGGVERLRELQKVDGNLSLGVHMYDRFRESGKIEELFQYMDKAGVPWMIGEFSIQTPGCAGEIDYRKILQLANQFRVGYQAWSWGHGNGDCRSMDMTVPNGNFSDLTTWGKVVADDMKGSALYID